MHHWRNISLILALALACTLPVLASDLSRWYQVKGGEWVVSPSEAREVQEKLKALLPTKSPSPTQPQRGIQHYVVQFQGATISGAKVIKVFGGCDFFDRTRKQLTHDWIRILDGGSCYFEATYDLSTKKWLDFGFHGHA